MEVRFEDRFEDQHQAGLNNPIGNGRDPQPPVLARRFRDQPLLDRRRANVPDLSCARSPARKSHHLGSAAVIARAVSPSIPAERAPGVARHPFPCDQQESGVDHEVEQIGEPGRGVPASTIDATCPAFPVPARRAC